MQVRLHPDPGPSLARALATLLATEGLLPEHHAAYGAAWRCEALREGVTRAYAGSRAGTADRFYVAAPWPRRMRGAMRA